MTIIQNERGVVLIAGMLLIVILSILGIVTMQSSLLHERMSGNVEQRDVAFALAEAALRDGESWLNSQVIMPSFSGSSGRYQADSSLWVDGTIWTTPGINVYAGSGIEPADYPLPLYYLEYVTEVDNSGNSSEKFAPAPEDLPGVYRVTSRGESNDGRSVVILRTTFIK